MYDSDIWDPERICAYITDCAAKNGITSAKALAEEAGVDPSTISRLKSGQIKNPNLIPLARLFYASGASMDKAFRLPANVAATDEIAALRESEAQATAASEEAQRPKKPSAKPPGSPPPTTRKTPCSPSARRPLTWRGT